jgi:methionyl-tRNA formyltransferase
MRTLFFGTPAFAVPCLDALAEVSEVVAVVCQPDKPVGRGLTLTAPPVKLRALERGLTVVQPTKLKTGEFADWVHARTADVALVVAYGRILPAPVLAATRLGFVNVHASLLPKYRGAAPIAWAIVNGERETGVTLMLIDEGMDSGPMLEHVPTPIGENETAGEIALRLATMGAEAVRRGLPRFAAGGYTPIAQDPLQATMAPMLAKKDGAIDWTQPAQRIHDRVRGMNPWPGAFSRLGGKIVKLHATRMTELVRAGAAPGEIILADKSRVLAACGDGRAVELWTVQLEGKRPVRAVDWHLGRGVKEGDRFEAHASAPD